MTEWPLPVGGDHPPEAKQSEWLLRAGERAQHFRRTQYGSGVSQEHHLHLRALIDRARQGKQSAIYGKDLQFAGSALTILKSKDCGREVCEIDSRRAQWSVQLGEAVHIPSQYGAHPLPTGDYERSCTNSIFQIRTYAPAFVMCAISRRVA